MTKALPLSLLSFNVVVTPREYCLNEEDTLTRLDEVEAPRAKEPEMIALGVAVVQALVDGHEPLDSFHGRPFDALAALLHARSPGLTDMNLYTCSCGVPECAGLFQGVLVDVTESVVTWAFSVEEYSKKLNPAFAHTVQGDYYRISFDAKQYHQALTDLEAQLWALAKQYPHMQVAPSESYGDVRANSFEATWPAAVARAAQRQAAVHRRFFGARVDSPIYLDTPIGLFCLGEGGWRRAAYPQATQHDISEDAQQAYAKAGAAMAEAGEDPWPFVLSLDWPTVVQGSYYAGEGIAESPELPETPTKEFLSATTAKWKSTEY